MPRDVLNAMVEGLIDAPVFSTGERSEFENRVVPVKNYIYDQQESDVIEAIMHDKRVDEETVAEYVEHVYAWETEEPLYNDRGERVEPDPLTMKLFEIEHLAGSPRAGTTGTSPARASGTSGARRSSRR